MRTIEHTAKGKKKAKEAAKSSVQTKGYRSVMAPFIGNAIRKLPPFSYFVAQEMLFDDTVALCMAMRKGPLSLVSPHYKDPASRGQDKERWIPGVAASSVEVSLFVRRQLETIWNNLDAITSAQEWGWSAGEITYKATRHGTVEIDRLLPRFAADCQVLTRDGRPCGIVVDNVEGAKGRVVLEFPYSWWHSFRPFPGSNYGFSILRNAYSPWWDKWMEGGALDIQRLFMHKDAYGGMDISYPPGKTPITGRGMVDNYEIAQDIVNQARSGSTTTRPSERDENGHELWQIQRATVTSNPQHINEYPDKCDYRIRQALEVPDDVITSDGTGAWAGKRIPLAAFYTGLDSWVVKIFEDLKPVLEIVVEWNFGPGHWFDLAHKPLALQSMEDQGEAAGQQQPGSTQSRPNFATERQMAMNGMPDPSHIAPQQPQIQRMSLASEDFARKLWRLSVAQDQVNDRHAARSREKADPEANVTLLGVEEEQEDAVPEPPPSDQELEEKWQEIGRSIGLG